MRAPPRAECAGATNDLPHLSSALAEPNQDRDRKINSWRGVSTQARASRQVSRPRRPSMGGSAGVMGKAMGARVASLGGTGAAPSRRRAGSSGMDATMSGRRAALGGRAAAAGSTPTALSGGGRTLSGTHRAVSATGATLGLAGRRMGGTGAARSRTAASPGEGQATIPARAGLTSERGCSMSERAVVLTDRGDADKRKGHRPTGDARTEKQDWFALVRNACPLRRNGSVPEAPGHGPLCPCARYRSVRSAMKGARRDETPVRDRVAR